MKRLTPQRLSAYATAALCRYRATRTHAYPNHERAALLARLDAELARRGGLPF